MMANEAPEKIWMTDDWFWQFDDKDFMGEDSVEYTRTDVFMEKAKNFFEENIQEEECKIGCSEWTELRFDYKSLDSFIRAFRKYVKG